jgi:AcrR family transcriptional regulator
MGVAAAGRPNQKQRTRKDLLQAAGRLLQQGRRPTIEEVAEAALVSRATAYRYFPSIEALLAEAVVDIAVPDLEGLFHDALSNDPVARVERVDTALHEATLAHEAPLRMMLVYSLERAVQGSNAELPLRQNRRTPMLEAALAPSRDQFGTASFRTLVRALALIVGTEAFIVCKDVLRLQDADARRVKRWAIRALIQAARRPAPP